MAKDLIDECSLPTPLATYTTGNAKADAALAQLVAWELSAHDPRQRPGGDDYDEACKVASAVGWKKLMPILDDPKAFEVGTAPYDEDRVKRLAPAKKKAYMKAYEAAGHARKGRIGFLVFLMEAVLPEGYARVLEIASDDDLPPDLRYLAVTYLATNFDDDKSRLREIAKAFDFEKHGGKDSDYDRLAVACIRCLHDADPEAAFDELHGLVTPAAAKKNQGLADLVLSSLMRGEDFDPRWAVACAAVVVGPLETTACLALQNLPPDPAIVEPIVTAYGEIDPDTYVNDALVELIARVATPAAVPFLRGAIASQPTNEATIRELVSKDIAAALDGAAAPAKPDAKRERPTLVFKKVKAFKAPKLAPLAKQEAAYAKMFAKAKIPKAATLAQRAVVMIPTRVDESRLAVGATKLGGHPDLPKDAAWPRIKKEPLTFVAQLRFEDFAPLLPKGALPKAGTLAIFVDNDANSARGEYLTNARAIFSKPGAKLVRREVPDDFVDVIYQACSVALREKLSLPSPTNAHVTKRLDEATVATYESEVFVEGDALPQVLGYRDHGYDAEEPATAQLLLQLTGDDQSDMEFGDDDHLSFFIDAKKLARGDFSKIWPHVGD